MRRLLVPLVLLLTLLLQAAVLPGVARAGDTGVPDVVAALRQDPVYVDPDAEVDIDVDAVREQIEQSGLPVYVAVLPEAAARALGDERRLNVAIGSRLGADAVLFSVAGEALTGGAGGATGLAPGQAQALAARADGGDVTERLVEAVAAAQTAAQGAAVGGGAQPGVGSGGTGSTGPVSTGTGGSGGGGLVLAVLALLGLGAAALYLRGRSRRRSRDMEGSRADVTSLYGRLGADVSTLHAGDDPVAAQALADAAERYNATGALLAQADTPGEYEAARRTVVEGLAAARLARQRLGLDPGPEIPPPPSSEPHLIRQDAVRVGDREYLGSPTYAPGRQHYWSGGMVGGTMVPGGWYGVPWGSMLMGGLVGSALSGGFGQSGYAAGYEEGVEDAGDIFRGGGGVGGGDWGGGGGGDWGGGGGDWGGGGGDGTW